MIRDAIEMIRDAIEMIRDDFEMMVVKLGGIPHIEKRGVQWCCLRWEEIDRWTTTNQHVRQTTRRPLDNHIEKKRCVCPFLDSFSRQKHATVASLQQLVGRHRLKLY